MPKRKWVHRWEIIGDNGKKYVVALGNDGTMGCDCPAWKFAKAPKPDCKHILAAKGELALEIMQRATEHGVPVPDLTLGVLGAKASDGSGIPVLMGEIEAPETSPIELEAAPKESPISTSSGGPNPGDTWVGADGVMRIFSGGEWRKAGKVDDEDIEDLFKNPAERIMRAAKKAAPEKSKKTPLETILENARWA